MFDRKDVMRAAFNIFIAVAAMTTMALGANGAQIHMTGVLCWAGILFGAAVVAGQTIPAALLLLGANGHTPPSAANHR